MFHGAEMNGRDVVFQQCRADERPRAVLAHVQLLRLITCSQQGSRRYRTPTPSSANPLMGQFEYTQWCQICAAFFMLPILGN